jgi:hypothetical protein
VFEFMVTDTFLYHSGFLDNDNITWWDQRENVQITDYCCTEYYYHHVNKKLEPPINSEVPVHLKNIESLG